MRHEALGATLRNAPKRVRKKKKGKKEENDGKERGKGDKRRECRGSEDGTHRRKGC